jgi:hypothetical protein
MKHPPQLLYRFHLDRWELWLHPKDNPSADGEQSFLARIQFAYVEADEWTTIKFYVAEEGEEYEVITQVDYLQRIQDIRDNECNNVADLWAEHQNQVRVVRGDHPVFKLEKHWRAMLELNLFHPQVNHKEWEHKPLPPEAVKLMDEALDKWKKENFDPYANTYMRDPDGYDRDNLGESPDY